MFAARFSVHTGGALAWSWSAGTLHGWGEQVLALNSFRCLAEQCDPVLIIPRSDQRHLPSRIYLFQKIGESHLPLRGIAASDDPNAQTTATPRSGMHRNSSCNFAGAFDSLLHDLKLPQI